MKRRKVGSTPCFRTWRCSPGEGSTGDASYEEGSSCCQPNPAPQPPDDGRGAVSLSLKRGCLAQQLAPLGFQPVAVALEIGEPQFVPLEFGLQICHHTGMGLLSTKHHHVAGSGTEPHHLAPLFVGRLIGVVPAFGAVLHLGGEQHGVSHLDPCLGPDLPKPEPRVIEIDLLTAVGELQGTNTQGVGRTPLSSKTAEAVDHAAETEHLAAKGGKWNGTLMGQGRLEQDGFMLRQFWVFGATSPAKDQVPTAGQSATTL